MKQLKLYNNPTLANLLDVVLKENSLNTNAINTHAYPLESSFWKQKVKFWGIADDGFIAAIEDSPKIFVIYLNGVLLKDRLLYSNAFQFSINVYEISLLKFIELSSKRFTNLFGISTNFGTEEEILANTKIDVLVALRPCTIPSIQHPVFYGFSRYKNNNIKVIHTFLYRPAYVIKSKRKLWRLFNEFEDIKKKPEEYNFIFKIGNLEKMLEYMKEFKAEISVKAL